MKIFLILFTTIFAFTVSHGQELNCQVSVSAPGIQGTSNTVFTALQTQVRELVNNTKWTNDKFLNEERIQCQITITLNEKVSSSEFKGKIEVKSSRPVYKSGYSSPMLSIADQNFQIKFDEFEVLLYNENNQNSNLINVAAYYCYMIIGFDYDSYSLLGGDLYFGKAQAIVVQMNNAREPGWRAFESDRNRYWLAENLVSPRYRAIRNLEYTMHVKGLDIANKDAENAVGVIAQGLETLKAVHTDRPNAFLLQVFFDAKSDEFVGIFKGARGDVRAKAKQTLSEVNPGNISKYDKITEN